MVRTRWTVAAVRQARRHVGTTVRRIPGLRNQLEIRPDPAEPLVAAVRSGLAAGDTPEAHRLAEQAWRSHPDHVQLQDLLIASLDHRGSYGRALELCVENAERRVRWLAQRCLDTPPRSLGPAQRIFAAGFFRSGSSTVLDYLRGVPGARKWTTAGEMRLVKGAGGVAELVSRFDTEGRLTDRDLVDFYLHLTGWKLIWHPPGSHHPRALVNNHSSKLFGHRRAFGYLQCCLEAFLALVELVRSGDPTTTDLERFFRDALGRALDAAAAGVGAEVLLIDQGVNAWRLPLSRFLPPSTFVIVHRDPRDQYVDVREIRRKPGLKPTTPELFAAEYRRKRTHADRHSRRIARDGHATVQLSFEDFVLDHERQAGELTRALALPPPRDGRGHYDPDRARAAIGRHLGHVTDAELATLTGALPEYLDHRVGGQAS